MRRTFAPYFTNIRNRGEFEVGKYAEESSNFVDKQLIIIPYINVTYSESDTLNIR